MHACRKLTFHRMGVPMRAPMAVLALAFVCGVSLSGGGDVAAGLAVAALALMLALFCARRHLRSASVALLLAFGALGFAGGEIEHRRNKDPLLRLYDQLGPRRFVSPRLVRGRLAYEPRFYRDRVLMDLRVDSIALPDRRIDVAGRLRLSVVGEFLERLRGLATGDHLELWARVVPVSSFRNPGDRRSAWSDRRLAGSIKSALLVERTRTATWSAWTSPARIWVASRLGRELGVDGREETLGVVKALVTGDRSGLPVRTEALFQDAGVFHVMAISGAHVAILAFLFHGLLRRLGCDERYALAVLLVVLPLYAGFCGGRPSVWRAVLMGTVLVITRLLSIDASTANALGLSALCLLAHNPATLYEAGAQLTFAATASIVVFFRPMRDRLGEWLGPFAFLAAPLAVSASAQLGVVPLLLWHFQRLTPIGLVAGLVAMPLAAAIHRHRVPAGPRRHDSGRGRARRLAGPCRGSRARLALRARGARSGWLASAVASRALVVCLLLRDSPRRARDRGGQARRCDRGSPRALRGTALCRWKALRSPRDDGSGRWSRRCDRAQATSDKAVCSSMEGVVVDRPWTPAVGWSFLSF